MDDETDEQLQHDGRLRLVVREHEAKYVLEGVEIRLANWQWRLIPLWRQRRFRSANLAKARGRGFLQRGTRDRWMNGFRVPGLRSRSWIPHGWKNPEAEVLFSA